VGAWPQGLRANQRSSPRALARSRARWEPDWPGWVLCTESGWYHHASGARTHGHPIDLYYLEMLWRHRSERATPTPPGGRVSHSPPQAQGGWAPGGMACRGLAREPKEGAEGQPRVRALLASHLRHAAGVRVWSAPIGDAHGPAGAPGRPSAQPGPRRLPGGRGRGASCAACVLALAGGQLGGQPRGPRGQARREAGRPVARACPVPDGRRRAAWPSLGRRRLGSAPPGQLDAAAHRTGPRGTLRVRCIEGCGSVRELMRACAANGGFARGRSAPVGVRVRDRVAAGPVGAGTGGGASVAAAGTASGLNRPASARFTDGACCAGHTVALRSTRIGLYTPSGCGRPVWRPRVRTCHRGTSLKYRTR